MAPSYPYRGSTVQFGFSQGVPRDVVALLAVVFVTFCLQFWAETAALLEPLRLTPRVWMGWVWQLLTYPFLGTGGFMVLVSIILMFFFARDVFNALGRFRFWSMLVTAILAGGAVALLVDLVMRWIGRVPEASLVLIQGEQLLFAVLIVAFARLYSDAQVLLLVLPVRAIWLVPIELVVTFYFFLRTHDIAGFLGFLAAIGITWMTLSRRGFLGVGKDSMKRLEMWWLRRRMGRLRRKSGIRVVGDDRRGPWVH